MKKVAIVGGGIFGVTAAVHAARAGHKVELFEALPDILQAASAINQYRLHRGYHYPRSPQTATSAAEAEQSFREEYGAAVLDDGEHLYAIAREGSKVSGEEFLRFCEAQGLAYEQVSVPDIVNPAMIELVIKAEEARFDPNVLRDLARQKLTDASVRLNLNTRAGRAELAGFDTVILAGYAGTGALVSELVGLSPQHQFEVCEKPVVRLPESFGRTDLVVMDGPFMCVDPIGRSGEYVLGNVVHAIHSTNTGSTPFVPQALRPFLNRGVVVAPAVSNFRHFIESGAAYIPMLSKAEYAGSLFTVRTVLPGLDATDARPTTVSALDDRHIQIFSGKIGNCVLAAREAVKLL